MADEDHTGGAWAAFARMGTAFASTPFPFLLGMAFVWAALRWDGHLHDQKGCYQLQEIHGKVFKLDTCSGKSEPLEAPTAPAPAPPKVEQPEKGAPPPSAP